MKNPSLDEGSIWRMRRGQPAAQFIHNQWLPIESGNWLTGSEKPFYTDESGERVEVDKEGIFGLFCEANYQRAKKLDKEFGYSPNHYIGMER